jgi:TolA-binding protein
LVAVSVFNSKHENKSKQQQKKQAAAEACKAEAAPVDFEQQVEEAAQTAAEKQIHGLQKTVDSMQLKIKQLEQQQQGQASKDKGKKQSHLLRGGCWRCSGGSLA